jgi:hypothetical protein
MKCKAREAYKILKNGNFEYKRKSITERTFRTMNENGFFKKSSTCECGRTRFFDVEELKSLLEEK